MQSFSRRKRIHETETVIKETLLQQLSYSVKEIQLLITKKDEVFSSSEECNSLIVVLESIFLHGLKKGIINTAIKTVTGEDNKPRPSFWKIVSSYTHKNTISTINNLSQIKTDVGRCRVWIRMALNEGELTSYFSAMEKDRRALNSFYSTQAFLRDRETCDTASKLLQGILTVQFQIPMNSSILNTWSTEPLMLSGVWLPPIKTPLSTGVDVAEKLEDEDEIEDDSCSIKTSSSVTTLSTILNLDESQALMMILETPLKKLNEEVNSISACIQPSSIKLDCEESILEEDDEVESRVSLKQIKDLEKVKETADVMGNSINNAHEWSSTQNISSLEENNSLERIEDPAKQELTSPQDKEDYSILLEEAGISSSRRINYETRLRKMMEKQSEKEPKKNQLSDTTSENSTSFLNKLYKIVREVGLKAQKFTCAGCKVSIGLTFGEARLCHFTGEYFCDTCHLNETNVIPSRLIFNWDKKKYPVCTNAHKYLNDVSDRFLLDVKKINPKLYSVVTEMKEFRMVRVQLNMLRAYLYTCREPVFSDLQKKVYPREYIYEFIDHYSINDLCQVSEGILYSELCAIVSYCKSHVTNCWLCSQKGFICEICKTPQVIYPFDLSTTYKCSKCSFIYHNTCLSSSKNCPKCKRLKNRSQKEIKLDPK